MEVCTYVGMVRGTGHTYFLGTALQRGRFLTTSNDVRLKRYCKTYGECVSETLHFVC